VAHTIRSGELRRLPISANAGTSSGSAGAPALPIAPSRASSDRYLPIGSVADTVLTIRSNVPASVSNVASSPVA
jgi:hypothetical protein